MKGKLIFATSNRHKIEEALEIVGSHLDILSLHDMGLEDVILEETSDTLMGNAIQKVMSLHHHTEQDCFAEDTGLEVDALNGAPGVMTARYAGQSADPSRNIEKLLVNLSGEKVRSARFRTVVALIMQRALYCFEGVVEGTIAESPQGKGGFGYDPVFIPQGYKETFAELPVETKNTLSHRAQAMQKMLAFLCRESQI